MREGVSGKSFGEEGADVQTKHYYFVLLNSNVCVKNRNKNVTDMTRLDLDEIFCFDQDRIWYLGCERIICFNVPFSK